MAAITTQSITQDGAFALTFATLSASDTITVAAGLTAAVLQG